MAKSKIEWTQQTWNPIVGCSIVSPGCSNCYAMKMAARIEAMNAGISAPRGRFSGLAYRGTTKKVNGNAVWTGKVARAGEHVLIAPLRRKKPTTYFVNSMGDLFHEDVPDEWIDQVFAVMAMSPQHTFQVLTKRAARMRSYCRNQINLGRWRRAIRDIAPDREPSGLADPLPNVWLGVSTERQQEADERIPFLLETPAAVRFISAEPLLGPIDLREVIPDPLAWNLAHGFKGLDWVIVGGESGPSARPMHPNWARSLRDQCDGVLVPFFFKQWGAWQPHKPRAGGDLGGDVRAGRVRIVHPTGQSGLEVFEETGRNTVSGSRYMIDVGKAKAGRVLDGVTHNAMPTP